MLLISFGTRPEYIKIKPLLKTFAGNVNYELLFTGQHEDLLNDVNGPNIRRLKIQDGLNRLDSIVSSIMNQDHVFSGVDSVIVQGDTTSAFAVALAAFHRKIKIVHLEAGLRTWDLKNPYPEEFNRQAVSRMANIHLCPTELSAQNLRDENIHKHVHVVGNTVLDNIQETTIQYTDLVLVTMHRRENHDIMDKWFATINELATLYPELNFVIPLHPNPNVRKHANLLSNLKIISPLSHEEFMNLISKCRLIITDSGGIQEESSFLRKKCIVCRKTTERPEGLGEFSRLCADPSDLRGLFEWVNKGKNFIPDSKVPCPYGDGNASTKILKILLSEERNEE
jgi:UDP-N-acetylglucosamine 2-epimerase (non-hydrolysing)